MEIIIGEVASDEIAKKIIDAMTCTSQLVRPPKMSLEELIEAARSVNNEINMFEARWVDKLDMLNYQDAINLIFAEIDRYPVIKKYNAGKQKDLQCNLVEGLYKALGVDFKASANWSYVKEVLIMRLTPNRWV